MVDWIFFFTGVHSLSRDISLLVNVLFWSTTTVVIDTSNKNLCWTATHLVILDWFGSGLKQVVDCRENGDELWGFYKIRGISWVVEQLSVLWEGLWCIDLVVFFLWSSLFFRSTAIYWGSRDIISTRLSLIFTHFLTIIFIPIHN